HTPTWVDPISVTAQGKRIHAIPPNSQGIALLMQLGMAGNFPLAGMGHNSAEYLHSAIELKKIAFADRDRWVADPEFAPSRAPQLLDPGYLQGRAALVGDRAAERVDSGFGPPLAASEPGDGLGDTVYLMAIDSVGNAVSWIQSLFGAF